MAPRANWKGFLRLSLVTCPVALYPATSDTEKVSFNQINRKTGHRIKYAKVDADTGEEVANECLDTRCRKQRMIDDPVPAFGRPDRGRRCKKSQPGVKPPARRYWPGPARSGDG